MINITVILYYHLKEKAGSDKITFRVKPGITIKEIKQLAEIKFPALRTHLENIMMVSGRKIVMDDDIFKEDREIRFLTPIGGG